LEGIKKPFKKEGSELVTKCNHLKLKLKMKKIFMWTGSLIKGQLVMISYKFIKLKVMI
jgi:hypothetical protein